MTIKVNGNMAMFTEPQDRDYMVLDIMDSSTCSTPVYITWDMDRGGWVIQVPKINTQGHIEYVGGKPVLREKAFIKPIDML